MVGLFGLYELPDLIAFVLGATGLLSMEVWRGKTKAIDDELA